MRSRFVCSLLTASLGGASAADCLGTDKCPVWPREFSAPFALHANIPPISNASASFYYKYMADNTTRAQLVDYSRCFPFVSVGGFFSSKPCKLLFIPSGIYLMQPARGIPCCTFVSGVGAVPPNFLHAYTLAGSNVSAPDMYGNSVSCDHWTGLSPGPIVPIVDSDSSPIVVR